MAETVASEPNPKARKPLPMTEKESVIIRFSGDSGDGMQVTGNQFTNTSAIMGNDVSTFPDYPAEIRAPVGTIAGLSGFQVNFSSKELHTAGDAPQVLVAMIPAAIKANLADLEPGGIIIANTDGFTKNNLRKAGYDSNPLEDGSLKGYEVYQVPLTSLNRKTLEAVEGLGNKGKDISKNVFALGMLFWLFDRSIDPTLDFIKEYYGNPRFRPQVVQANTLSLKAGYYYGENTEIFQYRVNVPSQEQVEPGVYRRITGNEALVLGMVTAATKAGKPLFYGSYPITPASTILEGLAKLKHYDVRTFQAEDEIAAIGSVVGAAFGGAFAATASSGPGIALKSEGISLAVALELPLVVINIQRGGPSTGLPTKTEQADLLEVLYGRHGECPMPVIAPATPGECFDMALEAFRLAVHAMTPVFLLSDGLLASSSAPWKVPDPDAIEPIEVEHRTDPEGYMPYMRDPQTFARPWVLPGTPGLEHRVGGLGKEDGSGNVSYTPDDHEHIIKLRQEKIDRIADHIPLLQVAGPAEGDLLVLGWGGTYGAIREAVERAQEKGHSVAHAQLRYLNPLPKNLGQVLNAYKKVLVPELNLGHLAMLVQAKFPVRVVQLNKVQGQPFKIRELADKISQLLT